MSVAARLLGMLAKKTGTVAAEGAESFITHEVPQLVKEGAEHIKLAQTLPTVSDVAARTMGPVRPIRTRLDVENAARLASEGMAPGRAATENDLFAHFGKRGFNKKLVPQLFDAKNRRMTHDIDAAAMVTDRAVSDLRTLVNGGADIEEVLGAVNGVVKSVGHEVGFTEDAARALAKNLDDGGHSIIMSGDITPRIPQGEGTELFSPLRNIAETGLSTDEFRNLLRNSSDDEIRRLGLQLATPTQAPTWGGAMREFMYNSMLSRVGSQVWNIGGMGVMTGLNIAEKYLQAGFSKMFGAHGSGMTFTEVNDVVLGYLQGFKSSLAETRVQWKLGNEGVFGASIHEMGRTPQITPELFGLQPGDQLYKTAKFMGSVMRTPTNTLSFADDFFKMWHFNAEKTAWARGQARLAGENGEQVFNELMNGPLPDALADTFKQNAKVLTLTNELVRFDPTSDMVSPHGFNSLQTFGSMLYEYKDRHPWVNLLVPFVRTNVNSMQVTLDRFPVINALSPKLWKDINAGGARRELALAKVTSGALLATTIGGLAAQGFVTGKAPSHPDLRKTWLANHPEHAVNIGGTWITYRPDSTLGLLVSTAANVGKAIGTEGDDAEKGGIFAKAAMLTSVLGGELMDQAGFLEPFGELFEMMGQGKYPTGQNVGNQMLKEFFGFAAQRVIPGIAVEAARALDPVRKDVKDFNDYIVSLIPGYGNLEPDLDGFGRMVDYGYGYNRGMFPSTFRFMAGSHMRTGEVDPVDEEMLRLDMGVREPTVIEGVKLDARQRNRILQIAGPKALEQVRNVMGTDLYKQVSDGHKREIIKGIMYSMYDYGKFMLMQEDEALMSQIWQTSIERNNI